MSSREPRRWSKNAPDYNNDLGTIWHPLFCDETCYFCKTETAYPKEFTLIEPEQLPSHYEGYGPPQEA